MNVKEREAREAIFLAEFKDLVADVFDEVHVKWTDYNNALNVTVWLGDWRNYCSDLTFGHSMTAEDAALVLLRSVALRLKALSRHNI